MMKIWADKLKPPVILPIYVENTNGYNIAA